MVFGPGCAPGEVRRKFGVSAFSEGVARPLRPGCATARMSASLPARSAPPAPAGGGLRMGFLGANRPESGTPRTGGQRRQLKPPAPRHSYSVVRGEPGAAVAVRSSADEQTGRHVCRPRLRQESCRLKQASRLSFAHKRPSATWSSGEAGSPARRKTLPPNRLRRGRN